MKISRSARKSLRTGLRWKKGQSSSSNPGCRRFRDAAAKRVQFAAAAPTVSGVGAGVGGVTKAALARHDRRLEGRGDNSEKDEEEQTLGSDDDRDDEADAGSVETWATNFTGCTNRCFDKVLAHWADKQNSEARRQALAVLAAVAQVIRDRGGSETNEEYFQALLTALVSVDLAMRPAAAHLLSVLLRRMDAAAVAPAFAPLSRACLQLLHNAGGGADNNPVPMEGAKADGNDAETTLEPHMGMQRSLLLCLGAALAALPKTTWHAAATRQVLQAVLQFTQSDRPRLRKAALSAVSDVLGATRAAVPVALATAYALDLLRRLPPATATARKLSGGVGVGVAALRLLRAAAAHQTERQARATVEALLAAAPIADGATFAEAMLTIRAVFWRRLSPQLTGQALTALYEARPPLEDAESARVWLETARAGVGALAPPVEGDGEAEGEKVDYAILEAHWAKLFGEAFRWLSHSGATEAARRACRDTCHHLMTELAPRFHRPSALAAARSVAMATLETGLSYQFYAAWPHVSRLLAAFFRCHGRDCDLRRCLALLADLRDSADDQDGEICGCLESALAAALETLGPAAFLSAVPASGLLSGPDGFPDTGAGLQRSWLLPMLRRHVRRGAELSAFARHLLPLASRCQQASAAGSPAARVLELQVWSTLPAFCCAPSDFAESVPAFARRLGDMLNTRPDLRLPLLAALRRLLAAAAETGAPPQWRAAMSGYAKNFAPRLFALHTDPAASRPHRLAALETVRAYAPLFPADLLATWFAKAAEKATGSATGSREAADLAIAMAGSLRNPTPAVDLCPRWWASEDPAMQKKGYRLAEMLLASARRRMSISETVAQLAHLSIDADADASIRRLAALLMEAAAAGPAAPSSRKSRLRCIALCVASSADWLPDGVAGEEARLRLAEMALPEAVLGSRELNRQARDAADSLLLEVFKFYSAHHTRRQDAATEVREDEVDGSTAPSEAAVGFLSAVFSAAGAAGSPDTLQAALYSVTGLLGHMRHCMGRELLASLLRRLSDTLGQPDSPRTLVKAALRCLASVVRKFGHAYTLEQVAGCLERLPESLRPVFRATVRRILTDLLSSGFACDTLRAALPAYYHKQLTNVRRRTEYAAKVGKHRNGEGESGGVDGDATSIATRVVRGIDDLLRMSDDEGEEEGDSPGADGEGAWLEEGEGEILDLRDARAAARIHRSRPAALGKGGAAAGAAKKRGRDGEGEGGFKLAPDGRMIIVDDAEGESEGEATNRKRPRKASAVPEEKEDGDDFDSAASSSNGDGEGESRYRPGGRGIHRDMGQQQEQKQKPPVQKKTLKQKKQKQKAAAKKAQGALDPYSFLALDRRLLNRKNVLGKRARLVKYKSLVKKPQQQQQLAEGGRRKLKGGVAKRRK